MATVYALVCSINKMAYVGCTRGKPSKRLREHRCLLRANRHLCMALQSEWNVHGETSFTIMELENCPDDLESRRATELKWLNRFRSVNLLYNDHMISFMPAEEARQKGVANAHNERGDRWTPEVNEKRRLAQLGKPKGHGAKISATKQRRKLEAMR